MNKDQIQELAELERSMKEQHIIQNVITESCFLTCIKTTSAMQLDRNELSCVNNCFNKFLQHVNVVAKAHSNAVDAHEAKQTQQQSKK
mmetsp:Transcript_9016/g.12397  ORF Transcript_9016/g.12397 Transcript_9016/m.12397 type:complete len:88 (-) Transcript_9016:72-335(-)